MSENEFFDTLQDFEIVDFSSDDYESIDLDDYLGGYIRWINPPSKKNQLVNQRVPLHLYLDEYTVKYAYKSSMFTFEIS